MNWVYWAKHVWRHFLSTGDSSKKGTSSTFAFLTWLWRQEHSEHRQSCRCSQQRGFWWQRFPHGLLWLALGLLIADYCLTLLDEIFSNCLVPWVWFSLFLTISPSLSTHDLLEAPGLHGGMVSLWLCHLPTHNFVPTAAPATGLPAKNKIPLAGVISKLPPKENR